MDSKEAYIVHNYSSQTKKGSGSGKREQLKGNGSDADDVERSSSRNEDAPVPLRKIGGSLQALSWRQIAPVIICDCEEACSGPDKDIAIPYSSAKLSGQSGDEAVSRSLRTGGRGKVVGTRRDGGARNPALHVLIGGKKTFLLG